MKTKHLITSIFLILYLNLWAQFKQLPWKGNNKFLDSILQIYPLTDTIYYKIPVTFWIYPSKKGFGPGFAELKSQIQQLNKYFLIYNKTGIFFYIAQINIIPSNSKQNIGYLLENNLLTLTHKIPGTINIHLVNNLRLNLIFYSIDFGGLYNPITNSIILTRDNFPTGIAHEIGHYFGLLHPHRNWNKGKLLAEAVDRNQTIKNSKIKNCEVRGDFLCDTPAEPNLSNFTSYECRYTGNLTDPWGNPYHPNTDNIMSFQANKRCRKHFTPHQIAIMLYNIQQSKYAKFWENSIQNISFSPDKYEPDNFFPMAELLQPSDTQYHTIHLNFTAKKLITDPKDCLLIRAQPNWKTVYLHFAYGKFLFPIIKVSLYDAFHVKIKEFIISDPTTIKLPISTQLSDKQQVFFICIEPMQSLKYGQLADYKIWLEVFK